MPNHIQRARNAACIHQSGLCFYCQAPMAVEGVAQFAAKHGLSLQQAQFLQVTAEHLRARCEGGKDTRSNIAAACWRCNSLRHRCHKPMDPARYMRHVQQQMSMGRWHRRNVFERVLKITDGLPTPICCGLSNAKGIC